MRRCCNSKDGDRTTVSYRINTLAGSAPRSLNTLTHPKAYKHAVNKPAPADETENLTPHQPAEPPAQTPRLCGARARESHSPRKRRRLRGVPDTRSTHTRTPDGVTTGERGREIPGMPRSWNQAGGVVLGDTHSQSHSFFLFLKNGKAPKREARGIIEKIPDRIESGMEGGSEWGEWTRLRTYKV